MNLTTVEMETIHSALHSRETEIKRLLENDVLDLVDPNWRSRLREELAGIPSLKNTILRAWAASFTPV